MDAPPIDETNMAVSAPWSDQDMIWYGGSETELKGHVVMLVSHLSCICEYGDWIWPGMVEKGYKAVAQHFQTALNLPYSEEQIKEIVNLLHTRLVIFKKLQANPSLIWERDGNKFSASNPEIWETLIQEDTRFGWYREYGEPLWNELECIFDGWAIWHSEYADDPDYVASGW